jgi:hypothetical protein
MHQLMQIPNYPFPKRKNPVGRARAHLSWERGHQANRSTYACCHRPIDGDRPIETWACALGLYNTVLSTMPTGGSVQALWRPRHERLTGTCGCWRCSGTRVPPSHVPVPGGGAHVDAARVYCYCSISSIIHHPPKSQLLLCTHTCGRPFVSTPHEPRYACGRYE